MNEIEGSLDERPDQSDAGSISGPEQPHPEPTSTILVGPQGLRAGWRLLLYVLLWRALRMLLRMTLADIEPHVEVKLWLDLIAEWGSFATVALPAVVMGWIEQRRFGDYGLPGRGAFGKPFWIGLAWGITAITVLMIAIGGVGDFSLGRIVLHGGRMLRFAVFWGAFFVAVDRLKSFCCAAIRSSR